MIYSVFEHCNFTCDVFNECVMLEGLYVILVTIRGDAKGGHRTLQGRLAASRGHPQIRRRFF